MKKIQILNHTFITLKNILRVTKEALESQPLVSSSCRVLIRLSHLISVTVPTYVHFHIFVVNAIARLTRIFAITIAPRKRKRKRSAERVDISISLLFSFLFFFVHGYIYAQERERKAGSFTRVVDGLDRVVRRRVNRALYMARNVPPSCRFP